MVIKKLSYCWRLLATASAFTLFGLGGVLVPIVAIPVLFLLPGGRLARQRRARYMVHKMFVLFIHYMRAVGILRWDFSGLERLKRPGLLILANHPTLLDVVFMVGLMPDVNCIVKGELLRNPAMRGFVSLTGYIINRGGEELLQNAGDSLAAGSSLLVFPEGTRTPANGVMQLRRGAAHVALKTRINPTLVVIQCNPSTLSRQHKWYHIPDRRFVITIEVNHDLPVQPFLGSNPALGARQLTKEIRNYYQGELNT